MDRKYFLAIACLAQVLLIFKDQIYLYDMYLKTVSKWVVIAGTLLIWTVKFIIRPFVHIPHSLKPLVGFAPNLIGSFLLPFGACWFFQRFFKLQTQADLTFTCLFGLLLVIINEYLQLIPVFGRTFDYLDIFSSVVGVFCGHLVFRKLMLSRITQIDMGARGL